MDDRTDNGRKYFSWGGEEWCRCTVRRTERLPEERNMPETKGPQIKRRKKGFSKKKSEKKTRTEARTSPRSRQKLKVKEYKRDKRDSHRIDEG